MQSGHLHCKEICVLTAAGLLGIVGGAWAQGPLTPPPGTPGPVYKTLQELEPRTPISSLPFTIDSPGSYYLITNLAGVAGQDGITIRTGDVTLDLNGFALTGVPGSRDGITQSPGGWRANVAIHNGTIHEWSHDGIYLEHIRNCILKDLRISTNGWESSRRGITVGPNSLVRDCVVENNASFGILVSRGSTVVNCSARGNQEAGISSFVGTSATVLGCSATANAVGISVSDGSNVRNCTVVSNDYSGIYVASHCLVENNNAIANGLIGFWGGIRAIGKENRITGNHVVRNYSGLKIDGTDNFVAANTARGNVYDYSIAASNRVGAIVTPPVSGAISGSSGGAGMGTTDPWANFAY